MKSRFKNIVIAGLMMAMAIITTTTVTTVHADDSRPSLAQTKHTTALPEVIYPSVVILAQADLALPASPDQPLPTTSDPNVISANPFQALIDGLLGKYGWLTTVIMVIGTLRLLLKPIMMAVENAVANDPVKLAKVREFEAGPIFKWLSFGLDWVGSIKLPVAKAAVAKKS